MDEPVTLTASAYKHLTSISHTITNINDVVAMGGDVREDLVRNLLIHLGEQVMFALRQIDADMQRKEKENDAIEN